MESGLIRLIAFHQNGSFVFAKAFPSPFQNEDVNVGDVLKQFSDFYAKLPAGSAPPSMTIIGHSHFAFCSCVSYSLFFLLSKVFSVDKTSPVLLGIAKEISEIVQNPTPIEINKYVLSNMPFGVPISGKISRRTEKGKRSIEIVCRETVRGVQYDRSGIEDILEISGEILARISLDVISEITVNLLRCANTLNYGFDFAVRDFEDNSSSVKFSFLPRCGPGFVRLCKYNVNTGKPNGVKFPIRSFYQMEETSGRSARVLVQLKVMDTIPGHPLLESLEVKIPVFNRIIIKAESNPSMGSVAIAQDKKALVWTLDKKTIKSGTEAHVRIRIEYEPIAPASATANQNDQVYVLAPSTPARSVNGTPGGPPTPAASSAAQSSTPTTPSNNSNSNASNNTNPGKTPLKLALQSPSSTPSQVLLSSPYDSLYQLNSNTGSPEESFFGGNTSYIVVSFRLSSFLLSGLDLDPSQVMMMYNKPAISVVKESLAEENAYIVWNSHGDARLFTTPDFI